MAQNLYILAFASTFAGNFLVIGSIANLITFEQARKLGVFIAFREHAKVGFPVTAASIMITLICKTLLTLEETSLRVSLSRRLLSTIW